MIHDPASVPEPPRRRVVVLGGGACGMTAAWELAGAGAAVTVLEREPRLGGLCATHERDGFRFDLGGHRFISRSGELVERVRGLLGEELLTRRRRSTILLGDRRYRYPLDAADLLENLRPLDAARALASFGRARFQSLVRPAPDVSFEDWVSARFGRYLYDMFFGPYTEKLWGIPPSELSADWAAERVSLLDLGDALLRMLGLRRGGRPRSYARGYYYPRLGIGHLFEAMGRAIEGLGARVELGATVTGLGLDRRGAAREVHFTDGRGASRAIPCDHLISTVSLPVLARWLRPGDAAVERHAASLRYRAVRFLNVMLDLDEVTPNTWMYVSDPDLLATRIQEPRHRSPEMAPPGKTSLMLEIPCDEGGEIWRAGDEPLWERCLADLRRLGLGHVGARVRGLFSTRVSEGYPIYRLGYAEHQRALLDACARAPNVASVGRQGTFRYIFMDIAMEMGLSAARQLLGGAIDQRAFLRFRSDRELIESQSVTA